MNKNHPHELLSAWHDGEASPHERREAERLLDASPEARRELDEIAALSETLRSLPRGTAPDELSPSVMNRIELESLLPAPAERASSNTARAWVATIGGLVATAAVLFLMVRTFDAENDVDSTDLTAVRSADSKQRDDSDPRLLTRHERALHEPRAEADFAEPEAARRGGADRNLAEDAARDEGAKLSAGTAPAGLPEERQAAAPHPAPAREAAAEKLASTNGVNWGDLQVGQVIPYLAVDGDRTAVIEVTVIDVQKGIDTLQILLANNSVLPIDGERAEMGQELHFKKGHRPDDNGLFAVYVELTEEQLRQTWDDLRKEGQGLVVDLGLQPPVSLSDVEVADAAPPEERRRFVNGTMPRETLQRIIARNRHRPASVPPMFKSESSSAQPFRIARKPDADDDLKDRAKEPAAAPDSEPLVTRKKVESKLQEQAGTAAADGTSVAASERDLPVRAPRPGDVAPSASFQVLVNLPAPSSPGPRRKGSVDPGGADKEPQAGEALAQLDRANVSPNRAAAPIRVMFVFYQRSPER